MPPMSEATHGKAVAIASSSELLIPSATSRQDKHVGRPERIGDVGDRTQEPDAPADPQRLGLRPEPLALRPLTDQHKARPGRRRHRGPGKSISTSRFF